MPSSNVVGLRAILVENPECFIALMLSTPSPEPPDITATVTVEFAATEVIVRARNVPSSPTGPRILASKHTIFTAILLYQMITRRGAEFAETLVDRASAFGRGAARINADFDTILHEGWHPFGQSPDADSSSFFRELEMSTKDFKIAQHKTHDALSFLEQEGLVIDPAFMPELMILAGLVPMHFSVRTPKGERLYREIRVNAPLWSLDVSRGKRSNRTYTDIEFKFRGIEIVRKALIAMATHYLEAEESTRRDRGQPVLRRKGTPSLDGGQDG